MCYLYIGVEYITLQEDQIDEDLLEELNTEFSHIMRLVKAAFCDKVKENATISTEIRNWVECYLHLEYGTIDNDLDDIFKKIDHYYDFIDCSLIVNMCKEFFHDDQERNYLVDELNTYSKKAKAFRSSKSIFELKKMLQRVYGPFRTHLEDMPLIFIRLQTQWSEVNIDGLYILVRNLLPKKLKESLMKVIEIDFSSVVIKFTVINITADSLIEYAEGKLQFMRLIGIFSLNINDHAVLQEDENMNFTFELALLEAVTAGHNEAVEFLLQLETVNIDHTNEEGKTALMLACERGHEDIVHSLLSAGANVNLQDNNGWTALMRAVRHNRISIINMLLQADAWLKLPNGPTEILMKACKSGDIQRVKLLLKDKVDPNTINKDGKTALMLASERGHEDIVHSLLSAGANVFLQDNKRWAAPMAAIYNTSTIDKILMNACQRGDTEDKLLVKLLLIDKVDPNTKNKEGLTALMLACERGHEDIVHSLLSAGANVNLQDINGWTALMRAIRHNHISIINMLLQANANPHMKTSNGSNALIIASVDGHYEVVRLLISIGVDYKYQQEDGGNAFMLACQNGHTQIVELLLKEQVDPNVQSKDGRNALMLACQNGHTQIVELLLKEQLDPNVKNKDGRNALILACATGHTQIVELLLKEQVDPNVQDKDGVNAFMAACLEGHTQIVELLLKEQVDPNFQNKDGVNAFMPACQDGHTQIVELLLKEQVDPNVQNKDGMNCFMLACQNGHTQIVELLLKEQVDPNVQNKDGFNAFMVACATGHTQIVELMLKKKVDPNVQSKDGENAFMFACATGHTQIVELLLKKQVDPNVQNKDGVNGFMLACENGHTQIVELLLKEQVDPNVQNKDGMNCFMLACQNGHTQTVELLLKEQVDPNVQNKDGWNAFMLACATGHTQIVELMLKKKVDPNVQSKDGENAFMFACATGHTQIVELLLKKQVDPNVQNKDGRNAFMVACQNGHTEIVELLLNNINLNATDKNGYTALMKTCFSETDNSEIIVQLLLQAGADPEVQVESNTDVPFVNGCTALMFAIISSHLQRVKSLLEAGADPNLKHTSGMTPYAVAVMMGQPNIAKILIESGANINDNISFNPASFITGGAVSVHYSTSAVQINVLMIACECGHLDIVQILLENGADPSICDNNGDNALHHTLLSKTNGKGTLEITLLLLQTVDPNIANKRGRTALMYACANGHREVIEHLLRTYDLDLSLTDNDGSTALYYAAHGGHIEVINVLLSNYDYNQEEIERALTAACYGGHKELIKELADKANNLTENQKEIVNTCINNVAIVASGSLNLPLIESTGLTPLMLATSCGSVGVVQVMLLISGADVNKQDKYLQYSPLLYAVSGSKSVAMVQYLLDCDADVNVISSDEQTPLDIARHYELDDITQLLESNGGKTYSSIMKFSAKEVQVPLSTVQKVIDNIDLIALDTNVVPGSASFNIHVPSFSFAQILPFTTCTKYF